jgi:hypothetical protein
MAAVGTKDFALNMKWRILTLACTIDNFYLQENNQATFNYVLV